MKAVILSAMAACLFAGPTMGAEKVHPTPYAGQQDRLISSLSASDIVALRAGSGWGLAKSAELNGFPGPAHLLELADELGLSDEQKAAIQKSFLAMRVRAQELGEAFLHAEANVDDLFRQGKVDAESLAEALDRSADVRRRLRETHLAAHLEVTPILTRHQKHRYAELRGYGDGKHGHGAH